MLLTNLLAMSSEETPTSPPPTDSPATPVDPTKEEGYGEAAQVFISHMALKGAEAGSVVGTVAGTIQHFRKPVEGLNFAMRAGGSGYTGLIIGGAVMSLVGLSYHFREPEKMIDRGNRLAANIGQHNVDLFSGAGMAIGAVSLMALPKAQGLTMVPVARAGAGLGMVAGIGAYLVSSRLNPDMNKV